MEVYTQDLVDLAVDCGEKINKRLEKETEYKSYIASDECCDLQHQILKILYGRLTVAFDDLIERSKTEEDFNLHDALFKIINEF